MIRSARRWDTFLLRVIATPWPPPWEAFLHFQSPSRGYHEARRIPSIRILRKAVQRQKRNSLHVGFLNLGSRPAAGCKKRPSSGVLAKHPVRGRIERRPARNQIDLCQFGRPKPTGGLSPPDRQSVGSARLLRGLAGYPFDTSPGRNRRRFCLRAVPSGPIGRPQILADIGALACCPQLLAAAVRFSEAPIVTNQFECHPYLKSGG
jgi:hypothetical protein